ncbi:MAG: TonB-dependent siderophore receptor [Methylococcales bacterium]|nr:TonB-dependent siderophore receptor [Methylococcales bacterium]
MSNHKNRWLLPALLPLITFSSNSYATNEPKESQTVLKDVVVSSTRDEDDTSANVIQGYNSTHNRTAVKTKTALIDLPQSITVIGQDLIKDQNIRSIAEAVRYVPGVSMAQGEGHRDAPIFRGNVSTSDMYVDGIRDDVQYFRDMYNIESVDVLKGPNAMVFGRGGAGGLINRNTKKADWDSRRELGFQGGFWNKWRGTADVNQAINDNFAVRLNGLWENADSYRDDVKSDRWGVNPTASWRSDNEKTKVTLGYEHYEDNRTVDRGIPSFKGRPIDTDVSTFFGDPNRSPASVTVDAFNAVIDHDFGNGLTARNSTRHAVYDKSYQNIFPAAVNANGTQVAINAYSDATQRENFFNQTDLNYELQTGPFKHTLLAGMEFARQETDNLRETGYFTAVGRNTTSVNVPVANPRYTGAVTFRQSATDNNNHGIADTAAGYIQDQIQLTQQLQAIMGVRYDSFSIDFRNNRNGQEIYSHDDLFSPRGGLIYKPIDNVALYANYSMTYVPRAGEQLASLTVTTQALQPERFDNYEVGAKWDITPELSTTLALYQLDRLNALATNPNNPAVSFLVDGQRTRGIELGISGNITDDWKMFGGYAFQEGKITKSISSSALAGATIAQVPEHTFTLWNRYDITQQWGVGLGSIYRSKMYAATDNLVTLPGYLRFDAAVYFKPTQNIEMQVNVENLFDKKYISSAHSNNNLMPGSPAAVNGSINVKF